jgi:hypothetical protein
MWHLVLLLLSATSRAPGRVTPEYLCDRPAGAGPPPSASQLAALVGRYDVALVNSEGEYGDSAAHGTLALWANDSARRYMPRAIGRLPGERPLSGRFQSQSVTVASYPNQYDAGAADRPAVEMIGATLHIGGVDGTDAVGERLEVEGSPREASRARGGTLGVLSYRGLRDWTRGPRAQRLFLCAACTAGVNRAG